MPILMQADYRAHALFQHAVRQRQRRPADSYRSNTQQINIGIVNNMPDSALEQTERQFCQRLDAAAHDMVVGVRFYTLPGISRADRAKRHLSDFYCDIGDLWNSRLDALIVTGTEPHAADLRDEPYWKALVDVLDWADHNTASTMLSCLTAHAAVLHMDNISRNALDDKCFGVFDHLNLANHRLTRGVPHRMRIPHSRWNDVDEKALRSSGYEILCTSVDAGVGLFIKQRKALFIFSQGHPEYEPVALYKEYRRDVGRYLRRQRDTYPSMPCGYFNATAKKVLTLFKERAQAHRHEDLLVDFPESTVLNDDGDTWGKPATRIFRNWLLYLSYAKLDRPRSPQMMLTI
jgi:homoserine O-succinyltransferase/O-acetyltransferase